MLLIVSPDKDFSSVIAEQAKEELKLESRIAASIEEARKLLNGDIAFTVTTENSLGKWQTPVICAAAPVKLRWLLSEIKSALASTPDCVELGGGYCFFTRQKQLVHKASKKQTDLTDKEVGLLQALAGTGKNGIAKEALLKEVWGMEEGTNTHTLETHIYRLRAKFRELGEEQAIVAAGGGYMLGWA